MSGKEDSKKADSTGEWRARTGTQLAIDTGLLRALDGNSGAEDAASATPGEDPYNRTLPPVLDAPAKPRRRSLDDMRQLSDTIKASRSSK